MSKCTFCGFDIEKGTGKIKIMKDGKVNHLCSMKCEKNMFKLKRSARNMPWTMDYRIDKDMRLATAQHKVEGNKAEKKEASESAKKIKKETKATATKQSAVKVKSEAKKSE